MQCVNSSSQQHYIRVIYASLVPKPFCGMGVWFPDYITLPWLSDFCSISFHFTCCFFGLFVLFCFFSRIFTSGSCARSVLGIQLLRWNCATLFCAPPMSLGSPLLAVVVVRLLIAAALLMSTLYVEVQVYSTQILYSGEIWRAFYLANWLFRSIGDFKFGDSLTAHDVFNMRLIDGCERLLELQLTSANEIEVLKSKKVFLVKVVSILILCCSISFL